MSATEFTAICWTLAPDLVVGRVAFCEHESVETARKSPGGAVSALEELCDAEGIQPREVERASVRRYTQRIRPSQRAGHAVLALPFELPLAFDVVVGELDSGLLLCEIVPFSRVFVVEQRGEIDRLVAHFVREEASKAPVEELLRWTLLPPATLATGRLRATEIDEWRRKRPPPERLTAIAERVDSSRSGPMDACLQRRELVSEVHAALDAGVNVLLVGEPRVGKSAVLREAVRNLGRARPVWRTTADRLTAGAKYLGEWQQLADQLIEELQDEARPLLWVDDLPRLLAIGGDSPEASLAAYLRPALREGRVRLLGEITPTGLDAIRVKLPSFFAVFREITVPELGEADANRVAEGLAGLCKERLGVRVEPGALALANRLLDRYVREQRFPGKLADLLAVCAHEAVAAGATTIHRTTVVETFVRRTGLPPVLVDDRLALDQPGLRHFLDQRVAGQPEGVDTAVEILRTTKAGLNDPARPLATLMFAGPTGVGKTALARALAAWTFGQGPATDPLVRLDMSELQHPAQVARLIGQPGGEPGELVRKIRERPFSVLLLDEIEKAHPVFFDVLLGLLDEGRLTDGWGRVTDLRGAIIILTTNLGVRANSSMGFGQAAGEVDMGEIRRFFRPELLNRIDRIVRFRALDPATIRTIAERELAALAERPGLKNRKIELLFAESVIDAVVAAGFDPALGARPLQRAVERWATAPLVAWLLGNPDARDRLLTFELVAGQVVVG